MPDASLNVPITWADHDLFEPTCELQWKAGELQQRWRKMKLNKFGHVSGYDYEWRDIPVAD
jgi:hypothetical protein